MNKSCICLQNEKNDISNIGEPNTERPLVDDEEHYDQDIKSKDVRNIHKFMDD